VATVGFQAIRDLIDHRGSRVALLCLGAELQEVTTEVRHGRVNSVRGVLPQRKQVVRAPIKRDPNSRKISARVFTSGR